MIWGYPNENPDQGHHSLKREAMAMALDPFPTSTPKKG